MDINEDFSAPLDQHWKRYIVGNATLERTGSCLRFVNTNASDRHYTNAQIDDYHDLPRRRFLWHPPLKLTVRSRFSHSAEVSSAGIKGTAGFGFWNDPFLMTGARVPALPRAIWFFYSSPPSDMKLDLHTPGHGWKAATIDSTRSNALMLAPLFPLAVPLMNLQSIYRGLWPTIQRALRIKEAVVDKEMNEWHTYVIEWGTEQSIFTIDGSTVLEKAPSPRGPLGFVMWLDNQYLVATPWGRFGWGLLHISGRQWMEVDRLIIERS
jgi:hypothetical protein